MPTSPGLAVTFRLGVIGAASTFITPNPVLYGVGASFFWTSESLSCVAARLGLLRRRDFHVKFCVLEND